MIRLFRAICRLGWTPIVVALCFVPEIGSAKGIPDWVEHRGSSQAFPPDRYLTSFAQAEGKQDALESAKQQATAAFARQISVQIESNVVDITRESKGRLENDLNKADSGHLRHPDRRDSLRDLSQEKKQVAEQTLQITTMRIDH